MGLLLISRHKSYLIACRCLIVGKKSPEIPSYLCDFISQMFAWPCSVTNGVVGKKKCSLWCNTETFFNNNNNGKASTSLLSAFYLSQLISYRASGGRRITNVFCFSPPSRKAYELTLKYIPVRVTSFPSRVLVHLLVHARIHFCTHTHTSGMTSFVPSRIFYFIFLPS